MHRRPMVALATLTLGLGVALPALTLTGPASAQQRPPAAPGSRHGVFARHHAALVREQRLYGYLPRPPLPPGLAARAGTPAAPSAPPVATGTGRTPVAGPAWTGVRDTRYAPGDPTDAVGPSSYIAMVNTMMAIYSRSGTLITSASANVLTPGVSANALADPQVMWDPATNRFYYSMIDVPAGKIELGFSKSANPTSIPGSFCDYLMDFGYGAALPDYQKLGSTTHDLLIGANVFPNNPNAAIHADVAWMTKPAGTGTITTCPAQSSFKTGKETNLLDHSLAGQGWTPIPAQQADPSTTGWVVAEPIDPGIDSKGIIDLYKATEGAGGTVSIQKTATTVTVPFYDDPSGNPAQQAGSSDTLDPLDSRFTHAVSAIDPDHGGATAVWTAHTVLDGSATSGTSEVRWYEINVASASVFQSGTITNPGAVGGLVMAGTGAASAHSLPGTKPASGPSLSGWGLTLPVNSSGGTSGNDAAFLNPARLDSPWLTRKSNGALDFWAPAIGATTPHSTHPRTELVDNSSFTLAQGPSQTLKETVAVLQVPTQSQNIIIGQLHGGGSIESSAYAMLHYRAGEIYVYVAGESSEIDMINNVPLGAQVSATITAHGNSLTFTASWKNETATHTVTNTPGFPGNTVRWQAGDYQQDVPQGASHSDGGRVVLYQLQTSHG